MTTKLKRIADPHFLDQYREIQKNRPYGRSGLQFLPEATLYFLAKVADDSINLQDKAPRILDYGCGNSLMLDALCHVLEKNMPRLAKQQLSGATLEALFIPLMTDIAHYLNPETQIEAYDGKTVDMRKYDPAIPAHAHMPRGRIDFITCTDVLEHIPLHSKSTGQYPLTNSIEVITSRCPNVYFNISTRLAAQILPDGTNAHCTLLTPAKWESLLTQSNKSKSPVSPVLSRDTTACGFFLGQKHASLSQLQYTLLAKFGAIDLIPYPAPANMPAEKLDRLKALQPHKTVTQSRYIDYWLKTDSMCWNNKDFKAMATAQMQTRPFNPQQRRNTIT